MWGSNMFNFKLPEPTGKERLEELCGVQWGSTYKGEMKNDKGERTNRKIKDQPFYHRRNDGKMKSY